MAVAIFPAPMAAIYAENVARSSPSKALGHRPQNDEGALHHLTLYTTPGERMREWNRLQGAAESPVANLEEKYPPDLETPIRE